MQILRHWTSMSNILNCGYICTFDCLMNRASDNSVKTELPSTGNCSLLHKNCNPATNFYLNSPPAGSTGMLNAIRCEQDTHTLFKNREGPDSPTQSFTAETSVEMVSSLMTLIQNFNRCSLLLLFSAPPPLSSSPFSLQGGDFASISLLSHWIFHKSFIFSFLLLAHAHISDFLTEAFSLWFPHTFHICHLPCLSPSFILPFSCHLYHISYFIPWMLV